MADRTRTTGRSGRSSGRTTSRQSAKRGRTRSSSRRSSGRVSSYAGQDYEFTSFYEDDNPYEPAKAAPAEPVRGRRSGRLIQEEPSKRRTFGGLALPRREESDFTIIACVVILSFIGLVMVTSSSYYYAYTEMEDSMYFFRRQFVWLAVGAAAMIVAMKIPLSLLRKAAKVAYLLSILFCVLVLFIGTERNGSTRWIGVGNLSFQPAELAKIGVALYMAVLVEKHQKDIQEIKVFLKLFGLIALPTLLVAYQNLSSGIIIACIGVIIMFVGGARWKHFFYIVLPLAVLVALVVVIPLFIDVEDMPGPIQGFMNEFLYRSARVKAWLDPFSYAQDEGYQTIQSLYAVASGGFFGRGLGQSIQKLGFIPEAHNDIIFSIICEELGLFGAGIVIALFAMFTWHGIKISLFAPNKFTALLSAGIVGQIAVQAILNVAVNTNSIPATGITLPFISYGGSSMLFLMVSVGIVLNISGYTRKTSPA